MQTFEFGVFFFCKQKTAYEMRISDWSSDVCSSELLAAPVLNPFAPDTFVGEAGIGQGLIEGRADRRLLCIVEQLGIDCAPSAIDEPIEFRSEEHTSELQSLMRISYAVFCLKKKTYPIPHMTYN